MIETPEYQTLQRHYREWKTVHLREVFQADPRRGEKFRVIHDGIYYDYAKNLVTDETLGMLTDFARNRGLGEAIEEMFRGGKINRTEDRPVLHTALRNADPGPLMVEGEDIKALIARSWERMASLAGRIRRGEWMGSFGRPIRNLVNIGIGGSDLGPRMATWALGVLTRPGLKVRFVSSIDPADLDGVLGDLSLEETLFVVSSKSFTTQETLANARRARQRIVDRTGDDQAARRHFMAITTNTRAAIDFGIRPENILTFWDWVGGRFSLCGPTGFPVMVATGSEKFQEILRGAASVDRHFRQTDFRENIPVIMGLLGFWYNNFFGFDSQAVIPYSHRLALLPRYLQQLEMESNGKSVDRRGHPVSYPTGPVIWGTAGTEGQHAFFQLLHQGTRRIPCDLIGLFPPSGKGPSDLDPLLANLLAQAQALAFGRDEDELEEEGTPPRLIPFKRMEGNRPSSLILLAGLDPYHLGQLIALYEHRTFVLGVLWNINSFDQWGVELGKQLARRILQNPDPRGQIPHDSSTRAVLEYLQNRRD